LPQVRALQFIGARSRRSRSPRPSSKSGDPTEVSWQAPGNKFDWISIYKADDPDLYGYLAYLYTGATVAGTTTFKTEDFGDALPPGDYEARLMRDDAYVELAIAKFKVMK
jgi:hypothetical protein